MYSAHEVPKPAKTLKFMKTKRLKKKKVKVESGIKYEIKQEPQEFAEDLEMEINPLDIKKEEPNSDTECQEEDIEDSGNSQIVQG